MFASRAAALLSQPQALLIVFAPLVWWGAFVPNLLWVPPVLAALLWYGRRDVRTLDVAQFAFVLIGVVIAWRADLTWFPALVLVLKFTLGGALVSLGVRLILSARPNRAPWGLAALGLVWLSAPSAVGLFALLVSGLLAGEIRHRFVQDRDPISPRGLAHFVLLLGALCLASASVSLVPARALGWRDPGGQASPFAGFRFGWPDETLPQVPSWLSALEALTYGALGLIALGALGVLVWALWSGARTTLEDWDLHWLKVRRTPEPARVYPEFSPEGVRLLYGRFLKLAASRGFMRGPHETPHEFEARVLSRHPEWAADLDALSRAYHPVRYGELASERVFEEAREALARLEGRAA